MSIDTGFSKHIDMLVDAEGDRPDDDAIEHCRQSLGGGHIEECWFNISGLGYDKDWMWVMGRRSND